MKRYDIKTVLRDNVVWTLEAVDEPTMWSMTCEQAFEAHFMRFTLPDGSFSIVARDKIIYMQVTLVECDDDDTKTKAD